MILRRLSKMFVIIILAAAAVVIILSTQKSTQAEESADATKRYASVSIQPGDSLWGIASIYADGHYSSIQDYIEEVKFINNMTDDTIYAYEYLLIPYYEG